MQTYSDYAPTVFDYSGLKLPDRQDWLVLPCGINRDSGPLELSNWKIAQERLPDDSEDWEIHRFNHWAVGWLEIITVNPDTDAAKIAHDIESSLEDYPCLCEHDYSEREYSEFLESWEFWGASEFRSSITNAHELSALASDRLDAVADAVLVELYLERASQPYFEEGPGVCIPEIDSVAKGLTRVTVAALLKA